MSTELETLRGHALEMATPGTHLAGCREERKYRANILCIGFARCGDKEPHDPHRWMRTISNGTHSISTAYGCPGVCGGCVPERDQRQWRRIADELTVYLDGPIDEQETLI